MSLKTWKIIVIIICLILGTVLHFTYELSNYNYVVGLFSAVNESVWEHLKLLYFPMTLMSIIGAFILKKKYKNYWLGQFIGIIASMLFVVIFFYTYTGILGRNIAVVDIMSFVFSVVFGEVIIFKLIEIKSEYKTEIISIILLIIIGLSFIVFTIYPPIIPLFEDPIYGTFGIEPKRID